MYNNNNNENKYYKKYKKYKKKYLSLKNNQTEEISKNNIHIVDLFGIERNKLIEKLEDLYDDKINIKKIDELRQEFITEHYEKKNKKILKIDKKAYQKYIDNYINKQKKLVIIIGGNMELEKDKIHYYNMRSSNNYYVKLDDKNITKQQCLKSFASVFVNKMAMNELMNNNKEFIENMKKIINNKCNIEKIKEINKKWMNEYKKQKYKIMPPEKIFNEIVNRLNKIFPKKKVAKRIIVIRGLSGSGKTTLGKKLKEMFSEYVIIETDDILDSSFLELYKKNKKFKDMIINQKGNPIKMHEDLITKKRDEIIKKNKDKTIIFVGSTILFDDLVHEKYFLNTDIELIYKRLNKRTMDDICKNIDKLKKLYENENEQTIKWLSLYKYKIRTVYPINKQRVKKASEEQITEYKNQGYKIMKAEEIIKDILKKYEEENKKRKK